MFVLHEDLFFFWKKIAKINKSKQKKGFFMNYLQIG